MKPANNPVGNNSIFVRILANADALAETVASQWLDEIAAPREEGLPFLVALSGGRITPKFFAAVVTQTRARGISFEHVHFFWADERCVSPTDPASNNFFRPTLSITVMATAVAIRFISPTATACRPEDIPP